MLDWTTSISDSPAMVIATVVVGLVALFVVLGFVIRLVERLFAAIAGGDLLRPNWGRGPGPDPVVDEDAPDRPLIGRIG